MRQMTLKQFNFNKKNIMAKGIHTSTFMGKGFRKGLIFPKEELVSTEYISDKEEVSCLKATGTDSGKTVRTLWPGIAPIQPICIFDLESDGLNDENTIIYVVSYSINTGKGWSQVKSIHSEDDIKALFENEFVFTGHNIHSFDLLALEKLVETKIDMEVCIDTLLLSWYACPSLVKHGLDPWGERMGIKKPIIEDWNNLTIEEYTHRCEQDVLINIKVYDYLMNKLSVIYDGNTELVWSLIWFLSYIGDVMQYQIKNPLKLDVDKATKSFEELTEKKDGIINALRKSMPKNKVYKVKNKPKLCYKKTGELSSKGLEWFNFLRTKGLPETHIESVKYVSEYGTPNPNSVSQVKDWLYTYGWNPSSFKYVKETDGSSRKVEQIRVDGKEGKELCPSVKALYSKCPDLQFLEELSVLTHRIGLFKAFLKNQRNGYLSGEMAGLTNCVTADTLITTNRGTIPIVEVTKEDQVLTHKRVWQDVTDKINNGIHPVYKIITSKGKEIKCTSKHRFYIGDNKWIYAEDMREGIEVIGYGGADQDNHNDTHVHGTLRKAHKSRSKLTDLQLRAIKTRSKLGETNISLAKTFGVSDSYISMILSGKRRTEEKIVNSYREEFEIEVVVSVDLLSPEPTYDISVNNDHSYIANGFVTHNTLRLKHRNIVNLPGVKRPYGKDVRGCLVADEGKLLCGSDLSSLESRTMMHFIYPFDPEYVKTMSAPDFDSHLDIAVISGALTQEQADAHIRGDEDHTKTRQDYKVVNYSCVPTDSTKVLCMSGWEDYENLSVGDMVMSYNKEKQVNEFTPIRKIHFYKDVQTYTLGNREWKTESTANHRWHTWNRYRGEEVKTTEELNTESNIINSKPYVGGNINEPSEAEFLGWLLADGSVRVAEKSEGKSTSFGKKRHIRMSIFQSDKSYIKELRSCIDKIGMGYGIHKRKNGVHSFNIFAQDARKFWRDRFGYDMQNKHEIDYSKYLLSLDQESIQAFLYGFYMADGTKGKQLGKRFTITQNKGNIFNSVMLAIYLLGKKVSCDKNKCSKINMSTKSHTTCQRIKKEVSRVTNVFCLTTDNDSFVMKQGYIITITGNSTYGIGADKLSKSLGCSRQKAVSMLEAYWKRNWAIKAFAKKCQIKTLKDGTVWVRSPLTGFMYSLRYEKDIFSTVNQSAGSFIFFSWLKVLRDDLGKDMKLNMHDEFVKQVDPEDENKYSDAIKEAIERINEIFPLNRDMGCSVQFGSDYSQIH